MQALKNRRSVTERFWDTRLGRSLEVTCSPIVQKEGEITGTIHIIKDVTPRHRHDEALQQAHQAPERQVEDRPADLGTTSNCARRSRCGSRLRKR